MSNGGDQWSEALGESWDRKRGVRVWDALLCTQEFMENLQCLGGLGRLGWTLRQVPMLRIRGDEDEEASVRLGLSRSRGKVSDGDGATQAVQGSRLNTLA